MPLRSMTGFAQAKGEVVSQANEIAGSNLSGSNLSGSSLSGSNPGNGRLAFSLSLKSVNHRFLDLHFRLPSGADLIEMQLRRLLKEKIARGHVEVTLSVDRGGGETLALNRPLVSAYIAAFRAAASEFSVPAEPDLNVILRIPG
ncbi:MAG: YicC/YloC family endoribonuclease, partial [Candidatus Sulfotelmatobacter sp.]